MTRSCPRTRKPMASFEATNISQRPKSYRSSMPRSPRSMPARAYPHPTSRHFSRSIGRPERAHPGYRKCYISQMANKLTNGSSLQATIKEAEKSGASIEKARQIYDLVEANRSSRFVHGVTIEFGPDSTDRPAVWVHLIVDPDLKPSRKKIAE